MLFVFPASRAHVIDCYRVHIIKHMYTIQGDQNNNDFHVENIISIIKNNDNKLHDYLCDLYF